MRDDKTLYVWYASLAISAELEHRLKALLSADECTRAERFYFERDRRRFIAARGLLRILLGRYVDAPPQTLQFTYSPAGKPELGGEWQAAGVRFNVSHSWELGLFAVCQERRVGVDVEWLREDVTWRDLAEQFFSRREIALIHACPPEERRQAFFRCWTRKEAYLKARGEGLGAPLDGFSVSVARDAPALLEVVAAPEEVTRWRFINLELDAAYAAAIVCEGAMPDVIVSAWTWDAVEADTLCERW